MISNLVLGESLDVLIDHRGKTPRKLGTDFVDAGVPVASAILVNNGRLDLSAARFVDAETWRRWMAVPTRAGDVLLTSEAPLGRVGRVETDAPLVLGQRLYGLRGKAGVLDNGYLYYALQTDRVQADLLGRSTGTTVLGIRQSALRHVVIPAPSHSEQRAIAEVLGALDSKIAANADSTAIIDRFLATHFVRLSAGRALVGLGTVGAVNQRSMKPPAVGTLRYLDISSVGRGVYAFPPESNWSDAPSRARRVVSHGDVVWSTVRPNRCSHALVLDDDDKLIGSTGLAVLTPARGRTAGLYEATRTDRFVAYLETVAEGSAYPAVRAERFLEAPVPELTPKEWDEFEELALPLREFVHAMTVESRRLAETRDELLPLLMSGKVRVKDAEKSLEGVL